MNNLEVLDLLAKVTKVAEAAAIVALLATEKVESPITIDGDTNDGKLKIKTTIEFIQNPEVKDADDTGGTVPRSDNRRRRRVK